MENDFIQKFELTFDCVDMALGEEAWSPEFLAEISAAGFSMKGGIWIGMGIRSDDDSAIGAASHVLVARRLKPIDREPEYGYEAKCPEFMEYMAFSPKRGGNIVWGAAVVNALIASNWGKLPESWLEQGMAKLVTSGRCN